MTNLRASVVKDHSRTDMHQMAMCLYNEYRAEDVRDYAPIAKALCTLNKKSRDFTKEISASMFYLLGKLSFFQR